MLHLRGLRMVTAVAGGVALVGLCPGTALAGGSFGVSFSYSSSPRYLYSAPVVSCAPAVYASSAIRLQPTRVVPHGGMRIVQHGDYYAYPTGVIYTGSSGCATAGAVVVAPPAPVVVTPARSGVSLYAGGSYGGVWRHARRAVSHHRREARRVRHTVRRAYIAPARLPSRHFHRASVSHRHGGRRLGTPPRSMRFGGHRYRR